MRGKQDVQFILNVTNQRDADRYVRKGWVLLSVKTAGIAMPGITNHCLIYTLGWSEKIPERRKYFLP